MPMKTSVTNDNHLKDMINRMNKKNDKKSQNYLNLKSDADNQPFFEEKKIRINYFVISLLAFYFL